MDEVRAGVDETDRQIVELIVQRFGFMDAAARIKQDRSQIRDEARKAQVLARIGDHAEAAGLDRGVMTRMYDQLIEASIAYEFDRYDRSRSG